MDYLTAPVTAESVLPCIRAIPVQTPSAVQREGLSFLPLVNDLTERNFGYLIAYVLPGFVVLWGLRPLSPTIDAWLSTSPSFPAGIESITFVGLAAIAAGMIVSAARWMIVDTLHAATGLPRPEWNENSLSDRLPAFEALVHAHYRHYQFYANMAVAISLVMTIALARSTPTSFSITGLVGAFVTLEFLLLVTSRNTLRNYYRRASRLLGDSHTRKEETMANGHDKPKPAKPAEKPTKPTSVRK